jgi:hypothetical protein
MNLDSTRADLQATVQAVRVYGPGEYALHGRSRRVSSRPLAIPTPAGSSRLVAEIANDLYLQHYVRSGTLPPLLNDETLTDEFCLLLSRANQGKGHVSSGWSKVASLGSDRVLVQDQDGFRRTVHADHFVAGSGGAGTITRPKDSFKREPTFYYAYGDHEPRGLAFDDAVRVYFAVAACGAPKLVEAVTSRLNAERVPFRFKILRDPQRYFRADRSVLYLPPGEWERAVPSVAAVWRRVRPYLVDKTPLFAKRIAPGLALAESPRAAPGESFGSHRCRLIAEGLEEAHGLGHRTPDEVLPVVEARFRRERISVDHLYLREGSHDPY